MFRQRLTQARTARGRNDDQGFTLIELLIVIVVLGVLAGIVVFGVGTFRSDSTLAACKANLKTVSIASDAYTARNGTIAADVGVLVSGSYLKSAPPASAGITLVGGVATSSVTGCTN